MLTMTADKCTKEIKEMKKVCAKAMMDESMFMSMDATTLALMQSCFRLIDASVELMEEQADMIEIINKKLDKLLDNKERA